MAARARLTNKDIERFFEFDGDDSTVEDLSDDERDDLDLEPRQEESEEEDEVTAGVGSNSSDNEVLAAVAARQTSTRQLYFKHQDEFNPFPPGQYFQLLAASRVRLLQDPIQYFSRYIPEKSFETISNSSNQTYLQKTGRNLNTTKEEIKLFFGLTIAMSYLGLPQIRMYWANATRVAVIADRMTRDRYFKIRAHLKLVNDLEVDDASKQNKYWKVKPLLETVRKACLATPRTQHVSVDEQMIPFYGKASIRQYVRGKPDPWGLKNFVCTTPDGVPLDFFMFDGKGITITTVNNTDSLDIGGKVVMKLAETLPEGVIIYMDRYFTSENLLDKLRAEKLQATGTLRNANIPKKCNFKADSDLRKQGRGSSDQVVRSDGNFACLKWYDNKPVILVRSVDSKQPVNKCRRWCKKTKRYLDIDRPHTVKQYNKIMGGVDMLDRVISFYRNSARSKKWTFRLIFHFIDFAAAAGWLVYRNEAKLLEHPQTKILDYLDFKVAIANSLLHFTPLGEQIHLYHEVDSDDSSTDAQPSSRKRKYVPQPPVQMRTTMAGHLPMIDEANDNHRCRFPGCKSKSLLLDMQYAFISCGRPKLL